MAQLFESPTLVIKMIPMVTVVHIFLRSPTIITHIITITVLMYDAIITNVTLHHEMSRNVPDGHFHI